MDREQYFKVHMLSGESVEAMGKSLKLMQILPEFHEGGVERHVLWLSNEMAKKGL